MKTKLLLLSFFLFSLSSALAQIAKQNCTTTKFKNGKVSTSQCMDEKDYLGTATAYDLKGKVIGTWNLSRRNMYSSVYFSFHENGMVKKADYSSHPDGGIQWYRSYTEFDEAGVQTNFWEQSNDDNIRPLEPSVREKPVVKDSVIVPIEKPKQETAVCAVIYVSELWLDNRTKKDIEVSWKHKYDATQKSDSLITIKSGERIKLCERVLAEQYESPFDYFEITVLNAKGKPLKNVEFSAPLISDDKIAQYKKGYVYDLTIQKSKKAR